MNRCLLFISFLLIGFICVVVFVHEQKKNRTDVCKYIKTYDASDFQFQKEAIDSRFIIIQFYSPDCDLCKLEFNRMENIQKKFPTVSFCWVAVVDSLSSYGFNEKIEHLRLPNVSHATLYKKIALSKYGIKTTPAFIMYKDFELFKLSTRLLRFNDISDFFNEE